MRKKSSSIYIFILKSCIIKLKTVKQSKACICFFQLSSFESKYKPIRRYINTICREHSPVRGNDLEQQRQEVLYGISYSSCSRFFNCIRSEKAPKARKASAYFHRSSTNAAQHVVANFHIVANHWKTVQFTLVSILIANLRPIIRSFGILRQI